MTPATHSRTNRVRSLLFGIVLTLFAWLQQKARLFVKWNTHLWHSYQPGCVSKRPTTLGERLKKKRVRLGSCFALCEASRYSNTDLGHGLDTLQIRPRTRHRREGSMCSRAVLILHPNLLSHMAELLLRLRTLLAADIAILPPVLLAAAVDNVLAGIFLRRGQ